MKIKFCGAARKVTGSAHLITLDDGYKILLDCGLHQGNRKQNWADNNEWLFDPKEVDCLVLSHSHIDHSGRIPKLVKDGFQGFIYSTHAARSLCSIMLLDSARIQERDTEWHNKKVLKKKKTNFKKLRQPLYTPDDIPETLNRFIGFGYNYWFTIREGIEVMFKDAGHILGSASVTLKITEGGKTRLLGFTGDVGRPDRPILRDPIPMPEVDYLICESTYGDKLHEDSPEQSDKLLNVLKKTCIENGGKLIIPAFSVGRTQEIVYMMDKLETAGLLPKLPVYVDSPLAVNATKVFGSHPECFDNALNEYILIDDNPFGFNDLTYITDVKQSKALNSSEEPCVVISSSGMMNAGRVRHHLFNNIDQSKNTFLIVGYCSPDTAGGMLRAGIESLKIFGEWKMVRANIEVMDSFSAHADKKELLDFIENQKKGLKKLFLVHGDYDTQQKFVPYLNENGFNDIEIPNHGEEFEIVFD
jgi:metallo-beta-lactamase family protein